MKKITDEQKEHLSEYVEDIQRISLFFRDDIKNELENIINQIEKIKNATYFKEDDFDKIIKELNKFNETIIEIDYILFGLRQIKKGQIKNVIK